MKHALVWFLALCSLLFIQLAAATRVTTLYQGAIPVASQTESVRTQALKPALEQVLIKITGNNKVLAHPAITSHLADANGLMQEFGYKPSNNATLPYLLTVQFDAEGINKILRDAAIPIWGANRPLVVAWVEYEVPGKVAEIIGSGSVNDIQKALAQQAELRGLPLLLPVMDVTDLNQVSVNDVVMMTLPKLQAGAKRYDADAMLVVRVFQNPRGYSAQAKLILATNQWGWDITGPTLSAVLNTVIDNATETLASRLATVVANTAQGKVNVKIRGVSRPADFSEMMRYVEHLTPVASVQVERITGDNVDLNIVLHSSRESFVQIVALGKKLTPVSAESNNTILVYQWNR